jgi:hypothetical protein
VERVRYATVTAVLFPILTPVPPDFLKVTAYPHRLNTVYMRPTSEGPMTDEPVPEQFVIYRMLVFCSAALRVHVPVAAPQSLFETSTFAFASVVK